MTDDSDAENYYKDMENLFEHCDRHYRGKYLTHPGMPNTCEAQDNLVQKYELGTRRMLKDMLAEKMVKDIDYILKHGYADSIDRDDFFHAHVLLSPFTVLSGDESKDLERMFYTDGISILYHTLEEKSKPEHNHTQRTNRNILSNMYEEPKVIHPKEDNGCYSLFPDELGLWSPMEIRFRIDDEGGYTLYNGKKIILF